MDALKQQLLRVQQQLAGLSASQKMLTASLLVIMVMTLFYWSRVASTGEMEAVINDALPAAQLTELQKALDAEGVKSDVRGGRIFAPASKHADVVRAMSGLALDGKLPESYSRAEDTADKGNFFESQADREQRVQDCRRRRVEQIIRNWPGVTDAMVILAGEKRISFLNPDHATASVSITYTSNGNPRDTKRIVDAARLQVAHVQSGLTPEDVGITVNGQAYKADDPNDAFAGDGILQKRKEAEQHFTQNIQGRLSYIPGVRVNVSVKLDTTTSVANEHLVDPKNKVEAVKSQKTSSDENAQPAAGGEPGVTANTGLAADTAPAAGQTSNSEKSETQNEVAIGYKELHTETPAGNAVPQSATIGVPDAYYRRVWKQQNPAATAAPSAADLKPLITEVEAKIRNSVRPLLASADDNAITVTTDWELIDTPDTAAASAGNLAAIPAGSGFGAKEIVLAALAVLSLFMVSMMVKKSQPQPAVLAAAPMPVDAPEPVGPGLLTVSELAGEVGEGDLTMAGHELSDDQLEARQVIEQVGTMVKQNPETAAALVKRWLNQD